MNTDFIYQLNVESPLDNEIVYLMRRYVEGAGDTTSIDYFTAYIDECIDDGLFDAIDCEQSDIRQAYKNLIRGIKSN